MNKQLNLNGQRDATAIAVSPREQCKSSSFLRRELKSLTQ